MLTRLKDAPASASPVGTPTQPPRPHRRRRGTRRFATTVAMGTALLITAACGGNGTTGTEGTSDDAGSDFPTKSITLIVPLDAGSAPDASFRKLASIAEKDLGQQIVIVNKPGGAGTVGTVDIVNAKPDGYTIGMSAVAILAVQPKLQKTSFEGPDDVEPLVQVVEAAMAMFVRTDSGIDSVQDLADRAKSSPGAVSIGVAGANDLTDLLGRIMARELDAKLPTVPMGPGKQVLGVLNGTVVAGIAQPLVVKPYVESGKMKYLGLFGEKVPPGIDAKLFIEEGYDVKKVPYEFLIAPKGLPTDVKDKLVKVFGDAVKSQEFQDFAEKGSLIASYLGPEALEEKLTQDAKEYAELLESLSKS